MSSLTVRKSARISTSKLAKKMTFLNECTGSVVVWPRRCGTQADELRPVKRCGDLAAERQGCPMGRSCDEDGPAAPDCS